ncbi:hypothetical protein E9840_09065 [Tissierella creatinini]|nr:hypothetical protein E9840_09065 [Tissierella creatinini]TJX65576.1 hypothetical protein E8P77_09795 [Soehngenia saccharolytica]
MKYIIDALGGKYPERVFIIRDLLNQLLDQVEFGMKNFKEDGFLLDELDSIHEELNLLIDKIDLGFGQLNFLDGHIKFPKNTRPKHDDLIVDNTIAHSLLENFTHIRPYGYSFLDDEIIEIKTWKDMYISACKTFLKLNEDKFLTFQKKTIMNGESRDYFSDHEEGLDLPYKLKEKVYICTRFDANGFRDMLVKIIKEYNFNVKDFKVYFKADYKLLHQ